ncbi:unnamed protein product [Brassica oleracea]|uniref:(rape) hypothetical protein n=2 Tax=Brassica napus TaxID=3708 RepID=A0A816JMG2_BRANA|nr:unnamed protein product [Brassica napus]
MVVYKGSEEESPTKEAATPAKRKLKLRKRKLMVHLRREAGRRRLLLH